MNDYVLDLSFIAFQNWWSVAIVLIFLTLYVICNIIPACVFFYNSLKNEEFWDAPMIFFFMLIPFVGSLIGLYTMWYESYRMTKVILLLIYGLIVCTIGLVYTL